MHRTNPVHFAVGSTVLIEIRSSRLHACLGILGPGYSEKWTSAAERLSQEPLNLYKLQASKSEATIKETQSGKPVPLILKPYNQPS